MKLLNNKETKGIIEDVKKLDIEERKKHLERFTFEKKEVKKIQILVPSILNMRNLII